MAEPQLRFRDVKSSEWKPVRLDSIIEKASLPVKVETAKYYREIGIRSHGKGIFHKEPIIGRELGNKRVFWVQPEALALNIVFAWEQAVALTSKDEEGFIASHRFPMFLPKNNTCSTRFLKYLFLTKRGKTYLELASPGGAGRNKTLGQKNFDELIVTVPSVQEQTKIANFLTAVDEKITQLTQKSNLLAQYKKGVMQKIFRQELRFKDDDGREFPEWKEKQLGEVAIINPKTNSLPNEFVYIDLESVEKGNLLKETLIRKDDAPSRAQRRLEKEDVLFQMVRPYQGNNLFFDKSGEYVASTGYAQIRPYENASFIYHYLHLESFVAEVINRCTGTSYPAINANDLATISVQIPCLKEQIKIANFLTAIADKITQTQAELDAMKQYKQGLLQQMFV
jgi:type I restriction enzyme S subunit